MQVEGVVPQYQLLVERRGHLDDLEVRVEVSREIFNDEMRRLRETQERIEEELATVLGIRVRVTLVEPGTLPRSQGKAVRVLDRRDSSG
jgi:phenylacetate-CoA ligase